MRFNSNNYHSFNESVKSVQNEDLQTPERVKEIRDKDDKLTKGYKRFHGVVIIPNDKKRAEVTQKRKENFDLDRKERNSKQLYGKGGKVVKQSVKEDVQTLARHKEMREKIRRAAQYTKMYPTDAYDKILPGYKEQDRGEKLSVHHQYGKGGKAKRIKEETEQVDELSKGLLKRYKAAATVNADNLEKEGDYYARHLQGKMKDAEMGKRDPVTPKEKKLSMKIRDRMHKKSDARREKIGQAERKLGENVEQVDELSKPLLKRYVKAATSNVISRQWKGDPADGQSRTQRSVKIGRAADKIRGVSRPKVKVFDEETEQVDEAGQAKLYRMRYSHGRARRRGDTKKKDAMGIATYDKQTKEDAKDLNRTGSAFGMRVKRLAGNRKAMGYSESTLIGKQKPMPNLSADELYVKHYNNFTAKQKTFLKSFIARWEKVERINGKLDYQNLEKEYKTWLSKNTLAVKEIKEETERAAEARHKRLMKMDIPGTFGDRDLRDRIKAAKAARAEKKKTQERIWGNMKR